MRLHGSLENLLILMILIPILGWILMHHMFKPFPLVALDLVLNVLLLLLSLDIPLGLLAFFLLSL